MSLEKNAKTTLDLLNQWCLPEQKLKGGYKLDDRWVPLEVAQFWRDLNTKHCRECEKLSLQYKILVDRIIKANKTLDDLIGYHQLQYIPPMDWRVVLELKDIKRFREVLSPVVSKEANP